MKNRNDSPAPEGCTRRLVRSGRVVLEYRLRFNDGSIWESGVELIGGAKIASALAASFSDVWRDESSLRFFGSLTKVDAAEIESVECLNVINL